ncbi:hypothetical protein D1872_349050 [compost metagenome]
MLKFCLFVTAVSGSASTEDAGRKGSALPASKPRVNVVLRMMRLVTFNMVIHPSRLEYDIM